MVNATNRRRPVEKRVRCAACTRRRPEQFLQAAHLGAARQTMQSMLAAVRSMLAASCISFMFVTLHFCLKMRIVCSSAQPRPPLAAAAATAEAGPAPFARPAFDIRRSTAREDLERAAWLRAEAYYEVCTAPLCCRHHCRRCPLANVPQHADADAQRGAFQSFLCEAVCWAGAVLPRATHPRCPA